MHVATRRVQPEKPGHASTHQIGNITIDLARHEACRNGEPLELTSREFRLLGFFLEHIGEVVTREALLDAVWGYDTIPFTRTVDTHIAKLRAKIGDSGKSVIDQTVMVFGQMNEPPGARLRVKPPTTRSSQPPRRPVWL